MTQQELDALAASAARDSLLAYAIGHIPSYECPPHLELLASKLEGVAAGRIKRLMVFMPPRHGKSNLASELFPAWYLGHHPQHQVMFTTYGQDLADGFGRKVRNAVGDARHVRAFPESVMADDSKSAQRFNTTGGGVYYAVGAGGAVTGRGADCMVEGTLVQTAAGAVPVENLKVGAASGKILSLNQREMRLEYRELQAIASREADGLYRITTESGRVLEVTGNHRVFVGGEYREASSISPGDVVVCLLQEGLCKAGVSVPQEPESRACGQLLQQGVLGVAPRGQEHEALREVRESGEAEWRMQGRAILQGVQAAKSWAKNNIRAKAAELPDMRGWISGEVARWRAVCNLLRQALRGDRSLKADVGGLQPKVEGWRNPTAQAASFCESIQGDAQAHSGAGWESVCGVRGVGHKAGGASHRQLAHEQFRVEPSDAMRPLPQQVARGEGWQAQCDVVAVVERVRAKARVYDIQVEENQNLFANGVCVHNCLIIDDPLKNREEADSRLQRDRLWDWYASTAYTRLMPGGAVVLIQCMTGDTPVLMADGAEKPLVDVRAGDKVATYKDGVLATASVINWQSSGIDSVYEIRTTSGKIVRANERHPFLVSDDGELKWIKTKDLRPGQGMLRVSGGNGRDSIALKMAAKSQPSAGDTAIPTTTKNDGPMGFARRRLTQSLAALRTSSTAMASRWRSMTECFLSKGVCVPSASSRPEITCERTGVASSALITAMTRACSGLCFATTAILSSATQKLPRSQKPLPTTSDFTLDEIVEISSGGREEVFDVQIEGTENFIANGLVSHNTRWHEDDLAGRLLNGDEAWEVVNLPAIAESGDALGREVGRALWPARYDLDDLGRIRQTIGEREFIALYQQRPAPLEGALFRRDWIARGKSPRSGTRIAMGVDLALSTKTSADYTAIVVMARDEFGKLYVLDAVRERVDFPGALRLIRLMADKWNPKAIAIEQVAYQAVVVQELLRQTTLPIKGVTPDKDKVTRAQPLALRYEQGLVFHEDLPSWFEDELLAFPQGLHDDSVDALVYAYQSVMSMSRFGAETGFIPSFNPLDAELGI